MPKRLSALKGQKVSYAGKWWKVVDTEGGFLWLRRWLKYTRVHHSKTL